jgi:hypothetical protein
MKKIGAIAILFSMFLCIPPIGCAGSDPCEELTTKGSECCAKAPDAPSKATCNAGYEAIAEVDDHESCETAVKNFKCSF